MALPTLSSMPPRSNMFMADIASCNHHDIYEDFLSGGFHLGGLSGLVFNVAVALVLPRSAHAEKIWIRWSFEGETRALYLLTSMQLWQYHWHQPKFFSGNCKGIWSLRRAKGTRKVCCTFTGLPGTWYLGAIGLQGLLSYSDQEHQSMANACSLHMIH